MGCVMLGPDHSGVPLLVDVSAADADRQVFAALSGHGVFYATGHGIPEDLMDRARAAAQSFFALPQSSKEACVAPPGALALGYRGQGKISLGPEAQSQPDTRESFAFSTSEQAAWDVVDKEIASGRLPPDFRKTLTEYWDQVNALSHRLLRLACGTLGLSTDFFDRSGSFENAASLMSLIRYDETASQTDRGVFRCGAHCDYGALTLLQQDPEVDALQVALDKNAPREEMVWVPVPPPRGTFVVNCGFALENWSNGRFKANLHRVVSSGGRERISIPFFLQPSVSCRVAPIPTCVPNGEKPQFEPVIFGEFLSSRYMASGRMSRSRL